ncbi:PilZ domain-containing protein [Roseospira navarrensis]|uniref:PilZ domain-containing protein n=1 Tax=Roseospira navarrensis TaxID=140058 RepID=A0A7X2D236_9PROT|nr:PilZ domain-containing protein [Roseospira navarrensis]MQX35271.1 hypothetical protein [Roseospira navarrensis]
MASPFPCDMSDRRGDGRPERRAMPRHAVPLSGRWVAEGRWVHVVVETISPRGASLSGLVRLPMGARGTLTLEGFPVPIPCDVRWSRDGVAGVAFRLAEADSESLRAHIERHLGMGTIQLPPLSLSAGLD